MTKQIVLVLRVIQVQDHEDTKYIDNTAELRVYDIEEGIFRVSKSFEFNIDEVSIEEVKKLFDEALNWQSKSRVRLEKAYKISEVLGIEWRIERDC